MILSSDEKLRKLKIFSKLELYNIVFNTTIYKTQISSHQLNM